jgi:hypothetical protein
VAAGHGRTDTISLTLPAGPEARRVALLVVGGLAARLDLTYDTFEDLELAVETALERAHGDEVSLVLTLRDASIEAAVRPVDASALRAELDDEPEAVGLRRVLDTVADRYELVERNGSAWLTIEKSTRGDADGS